MGETLSSVAASLWGDASLWYKLADANGLTGQVSLSEGQRLRIPAGVLKNTHNASTFSPYNPGEAIGDVNPTTPQPPKDGNKCGTVGQVVLVAIAVAVATIVSGGLAGIAGGKTFLGGVSALVKGTSLSAIAGGKLGVAIAAGAVGGAAGSIASQGVGVATGIQDKFSWNAVAQAAIGGGIGASGFGGKLASKLGAKSGTFTHGFLSGAASSALGQGIGLATGLQGKFDWAGVAGAAVGSAGSAPFGNQYVASAASAIANAATRSAIDGSSFGDNIRAAIPNVIGQAIGGAVAGYVGGAIEQAERSPSEQQPSNARDVRAANSTTSAPGTGIIDQLPGIGNPAYSKSVLGDPLYAAAPDSSPIREVRQSAYVDEELRLNTVNVVAKRLGSTQRLLNFASINYARATKGVSELTNPTNYSVNLDLPRTQALRDSGTIELLRETKRPAELRVTKRINTKMVKGPLLVQLAASAVEIATSKVEKVEPETRIDDDIRNNRAAVNLDTTLLRDVLTPHNPQEQFAGIVALGGRKPYLSGTAALEFVTHSGANFETVLDRSLSLSTFMVVSGGELAPPPDSNSYWRYLDESPKSEANKYRIVNDALVWASGRAAQVPTLTRDGKMADYANSLVSDSVQDYSEIYDYFTGN